MANILFIVFSGQASAIFDHFLYTNQKSYIQAKENSEEYPIHYIIETQWDNGGHTGYVLDFYDWLRENEIFVKIFGENFLLPPPMGDLKTQISRWAKHLIKSSEGGEIADLLATRYPDPASSLRNVEKLINILKDLNREIFSEEDVMNFMQTFMNLYTEFSKDKEMNHSVGNLFLSFLYFYSYLIKGKLDLDLYSHHHEVFFNFLKDLQLVPRGARFEFLIDGRYKLTAATFEEYKILGERYFDDFEGIVPVDPKTYYIKAVDGEDIGSKFDEMLSSSDVVVVPPGSLSNWMPLINKFKEKLIGKPLVWIVNSFYHVSEVPLEEQIKYIRSLGLDPIILAPKVSNPFDELDEEVRKIFEESYRDQGKQAVDFNEILSKFSDLKVLRCIPLKELEAGEGGIKYKSQFIDNFLTMLSANLIDQEINSEMVFQKSKTIADGLYRKEINIQ